MTKPRNLTISIPEPCTVPWSTMHTVDDYRRHCDSCATVVTDFSLMSDDELVSYLQNKTTQKTCGRFRKDQLEKPLLLLPEKTRKAVWWKAALLLPLTFMNKIGYAQQQHTLTSSEKDSLFALAQNKDTNFVAQQDTSRVANDSLSQLAVVDSLYQNIPDSMRPPLKCEIKFDPNVSYRYKSTEFIFIGNIASTPTYGLAVFDQPLQYPPPLLFGFQNFFRDTLTQLKETITVEIRELNKNIPRTDQSQPEPAPQQPAVPPQNENIVAVLTDNKRIPKRSN
ncbi:MAG: hypothetical protein ACRC3B_08380 [Bacteroidia bacterium]